MNITLLSYEDSGGGAGRSALKFHKALREHGLNSRLRVARKKTDVSGVVGHTLLRQKITRGMNEYLSKCLVNSSKATDKGFRSFTPIPNWIDREVNNSDADIVQLNWISGLLTIGEIAKIRKPLVWRLSDMWAFSGVEHYDGDRLDSRWRTGYVHDGLSNTLRNVNFDSWLWRRKKRIWTKPIHIITPSVWLANCVRESALMKNWPITVIPTAINTNSFRPWPKSVARDLFSLPQDKKIILFGALGGGSDPRKGRDLLVSSLKFVSENIPDAIGVIFGQSEPNISPNLGLPIHWVGHLNDDISLALLYSLADVMVIPSRQDNLPQTGIEAQCCGCPVVTFDTSGLPDLIDHKRTGYLVKAFDVKDMANGIQWILQDRDRHMHLSREARERSVAKWSTSVVVPQFVKVYEQAIEQSRRI
ncbi:glycosyltransferase [Alphaproteobacteria bacterium]|nr:glycosyltransferase [Alphaproteobacteria bacterium]